MSDAIASADPTVGGPASGGPAPRRVLLLDTALDPAAELAAMQATLAPGCFGATASFVGTMRDVNEGDAVESLVLEHYPGMSERELEAIAAEASDRWPTLAVLIAHRVGEIRPADPIVLTAVWCAHRAAAFDACRFLMEALKSRAPFWKRETLAGGTGRWVERNTPG